MPDPKFEDCTPFTDQDILNIEGLLGRELPDDYRNFVKEYGGCFIAGEVDGSDGFSIDKFYKAQAYTTKGGGVPEWEEYQDIGALPFAKCIMGNVFVMTKNNAIHYVNYYGGKTTTQKIADSFGDFISRVEPREYEDPD